MRVRPVPSLLSQTAADFCPHSRAVATAIHCDAVGKAPIEARIILLVEDNPDDWLLALRALKRTTSPIRRSFARGGAEALDYLFGAGVWAGQEISLPQVILLDLKLPRLDGLGVLRRIRGRTIIGIEGKPAESLLPKSLAAMRTVCEFRTLIAASRTRLWL